MVFLGQEQNVAGAFGLAVALDQHGPEHAQRFLDARGSHGRRAVRQQPQRRKIGSLAQRMVQDGVHHGGHQEAEGSPVRLQRRDVFLGIEPPLQDDGSAAPQRGHQHRAGAVRDGRWAQQAQFRRQLARCQQKHRLHPHRAVGQHDALRLARGAAGIGEADDVIGLGRDAQGRGLLFLRILPEGCLARHAAVVRIPVAHGGAMLAQRIQPLPVAPVRDEEACLGVADDVRVVIQPAHAVQRDRAQPHQVGGRHHHEYVAAVS
ncbi:hypothetical protein D9M68_691690 [compost metagenome]